METLTVTFDNGPQPGGMHFASPSELIYAETLSEVPAAFARLQAAHDSGKWLAGLAGYELGYAFINKFKHLAPSGRPIPLLAFGVFDGYCIAPEPLDVPATLTSLTPLWNFEEYKVAFDCVHEYIKSGDIYQANLTFPMTAQFNGPVEALYARLQSRQKVTHGALLDLGSIKLLSRSPELFFKLTKGGVLTTRPMKGTAPRGIDNITDKALRDDLAASGKNRAENLMIVDLLRNDMSIVSEVGSVTVPELFTIEEYETLFQMTSRITSQLRQNISLYDLFAALFPCGSITGAPKIRAMEILSNLEPDARDAYCGSIGWIGPEGAMEFNVAIRTLVCDETTGTARINVGGGVVYDSTAENEYAEALLKSKFAQLGPQI